MKKFKMRVLCVFLLMMALGLCACSKKAPKCTDDNVKQTADDIIKRELPNTIFNVLTSEDGEVRMLAYNCVAEGSVGMRPSYKDILGAQEKSENAKKIIQKVDAKFQELKPTLSNIRTDSSDDKAQKCACAADVILSNGNKIPITYTSQVNDKGNIYVEIKGLQ